MRRTSYSSYSSRSYRSGGYRRRNRRNEGNGKTVVIIILVVGMIIYAALFFGLRKYAVYTPDGLRLEVPWLQETPEESETP